MSNAQHYIPQGKAAIIRITDGGTELPALNHVYDYVSIMSFYDIEPRAGLPSNWNWFNMKDGDVLIRTFKEIASCDELVIHCHAGVSRSPAIALAYGWYTNDEALIETIKNGNYIPNRQVLNIMSRLIFDDKREGRNKVKEIEDFYKKKKVRD